MTAAPWPRIVNGLLFDGPDTGMGQTVVTVAAALLLRRRGLRVAVCGGDRGQRTAQNW